MSDQVKSFLFAKKIATSSRDDWNMMWELDLVIIVPNQTWTSSSKIVVPESSQCSAVVTKD